MSPCTEEELDRQLVYMGHRQAQAALVAATAATAAAAAADHAAADDGDHAADTVDVVAHFLAD